MNAPVKTDTVVSMSAVERDIDQAVSSLCRFRNERLEALTLLTSLIPEDEENNGLKPLLNLVSDELYADYDYVFKSVMKLTKHLEALQPSAEASERAKPERCE